LSIVIRPRRRADQRGGDEDAEADDDPLQAREAGVEVGGDRRQRGVDHHDLEHEQRRPPVIRI
jgi:hypothetical protein